MSKPEYVMEHIDETMEFPEETLVGLRNFKLLHREKGTGTFEERTRSRFAGMQELINRMADSYGHTRPLFSMTNVFSGGSSGGSSYDGATNTINMDGKLSILTLLHEFAHALQWQSADTDIIATREPDPEVWARTFSNTLQRKIYPLAWEGLVVAPGSTAEGYCLVDPASIPAAEAVVAEPGTVMTDEGPVQAGRGEVLLSSKT